MIPSIVQTCRDIIKRAGSTSSSATAATPPVAAGRAAVPSPADRQAPGFYRRRLGRFEVTALTDGRLALTPISILATNVPEQELKDLLAANFLPTDRWDSSTNLVLVDTGQNLVLIDTGGGPFQPTTGRIVDNLRAAGIDPVDIDTVVLSHGHPDHTWGIVEADTERVRFPNATFYITEAEWALWANPDSAPSFPDDWRWLLDGALRNLQPIAGRTARIKPGVEIVPGG